jgi:hypothetical protein
MMTYNQPIDPSRTRQGPTMGTGDAGVSLADDLEAPGSLLALVIQEPPEHPPTGIQHGLRHPCLDQFGAAHIAHDNVLIPLHDAS